jgi:hypothetical protein
VQRAIDRAGRDAQLPRDILDADLLARTGRHGGWVSAIGSHAPRILPPLDCVNVPDAETSLSRKRDDRTSEVFACFRGVHCRYCLVDESALACWPDA